MKKLLIFFSVFISIMLILSLIFRIKAVSSLGVSFFKFESIYGILWVTTMVIGLIMDIVVIIATYNAVFRS